MSALRQLEVFCSYACELVQVDSDALVARALDQIVAVPPNDLFSLEALALVKVLGRLRRAAGLYLVAKRVQRYGDLAAGLVDPLSDLGGLVDGDASGDDDRGGDDEACGEGFVRLQRDSTGTDGWRR